MLEIKKYMIKYIHKETNLYIFEESVVFRLY